MRIRINNDGRELEGTPDQILRQLAAIGFEGKIPADDFITWTAENLSRMHGLDISVTGDTEAERSASLLRELERGGFLEVVR